MTMGRGTHLNCGNDMIDNLSSMMGDPNTNVLPALSEAIEAWPYDARLLLMRGATLASQGHITDARSDLTRVIVLDPGLPAARFLLGYLELISGDSAGAVAAWHPLTSTDEITVLGLFAGGMIDLVEGRLEASLEQLTKGLLSEREQPALAPFIQSLIPHIEHAVSESGQTSTIPDEGDSEHYLLADYLLSKTHH